MRRTICFVITVFTMLLVISCNKVQKNIDGEINCYCYADFDFITALANKSKNSIYSSKDFEIEKHYIKDEKLFVFYDNGTELENLCYSDEELYFSFINAALYKKKAVQLLKEHGYDIEVNSVTYINCCNFPHTLWINDGNESLFITLESNDDYIRPRSYTGDIGVVGCAEYDEIRIYSYNEYVNKFMPKKAELIVDGITIDTEYSAIGYYYGYIPVISTLNAMGCEPYWNDDGDIATYTVMYRKYDLRTAERYISFHGCDWDIDFINGQIYTEPKYYKFYKNKREIVTDHRYFGRMDNSYGNTNYKIDRENNRIVIETKKYRENKK